MPVGKDLEGGGALAQWLPCSVPLHLAHSSVTSYKTSNGRNVPVT
jgi:hypothetical protein